MPGSLLFICPACIRVSSVCLILRDAHSRRKRYRRIGSQETLCVEARWKWREIESRQGRNKGRKNSCKEDDTRSPGGYHGARSEEPGHSEQPGSSHAHQRAAVTGGPASASATASPSSASASSPSWTDALCADDVSVAVARAYPSSFRAFSPSPLRSVPFATLRPSPFSLFSLSPTTRIYVHLRVSNCVRVAGESGCERAGSRRWRFCRGILVNDSGANTARGNIKNVPWDSVGLEEVWSQKRCWHPPPPTLPRNT